MCGRFAFYSPREAVQDTFGVALPLPVEPRYNVAPSQFVVALRGGEGNALEPAVLRWGLVPSWAKDPAIGNRMINARAETVHEKPSFRSAFRRRRCVVLADGYYEWRAAGGRKMPYFIVMRDRRPFAMAGLWERWRDAEGKELESCAVITTVAEEGMKVLHDRMPVILSPADAACWCGPGGDDRDAARELLANNANAALVYWPVSTEVNNPRNEGPALIESVSDSN